MHLCIAEFQEPSAVVGPKSPISALSVVGIAKFVAGVLFLTLHLLATAS